MAISLLATTLPTPSISSLSTTRLPNRFLPNSQTLISTQLSLTPIQSSTFSCKSSNFNSVSDPKFLDAFYDLGSQDLTDGGVEVEDEDEDEENSNTLSFTTMAVPKKRTSRTKSKIRKNCWKRKAKVAAKKAFSLAKSIATGNSKSFFVPPSK
uniref:Large ribosomal subunit protein bL32c n=1 Tax=Delphinium staphisagria TaxID=104301 RepID=A0A6G6CIL9_DELST|nr:ribosomal protein L32 [Staphisagria macrosperma]